MHQIEESERSRMAGSQTLLIRMLQEQLLIRKWEKIQRQGRSSRERVEQHWGYNGASRDAQQYLGAVL